MMKLLGYFVVGMNI